MILSGRAIANAVHRYQEHARTLSDAALRDPARRQLFGDDPLMDIRPFHPDRLNPNSYNLALAPKIAWYQSRRLDAAKRNNMCAQDIPAVGVLLEPGRVYLAATEEWTDTINCVPAIEGRSSVARLGLQIHVTGGFGDVGFCGRWTLELVATQPVRIYAGMQLCQIYYMTVSPDHDNYTGRYQGSTDAIGSRMYEDFEK